MSPAVWGIEPYASTAGWSTHGEQSVGAEVSLRFAIFSIETLGSCADENANVIAVSSSVCSSDIPITIIEIYN